VVVQQQRFVVVHKGHELQPGIATQQPQPTNSSTPNRRYMSSVEIPAEQLESLKAGMRVRKQFRSKSESAAANTDSSFHSSSTIEQHDEMVNVAFHHDNTAIRHEHRHRSTTVIPNIQQRSHHHQPSNNILAVSLKSLKYPQPEKQTMTDELSGQRGEEEEARRRVAQSEINAKNEILEKFQREMEELKHMLNEKNELINRQSEQQRQLNEIKSTEIVLCQQKNENLNLLLENQRVELAALKNKLSMLFFYSIRVAKCKTRRIVSEVKNSFKSIFIRFGGFCQKNVFLDFFQPKEVRL
jgi:hypothetical protein